MLSCLWALLEVAGQISEHAIPREPRGLTRSELEVSAPRRRGEPRIKMENGAGTDKQWFACKAQSKVTEGV